MRALYTNLRGWLLVITVGAWLLGMYLQAFLLLSSTILLLGMGIALICLISSWSYWQCRLALLLSICLLLGAWRYGISAPDSDPLAISHFISNHSLLVRGNVSNEPTIQGRSRVLTVAVSSVSNTNGRTWNTAHGEIEVQTLGTLIENPYSANYGDDVELQGKLQPPPPYQSGNVLASMAFPRLRITARGGGNPLLVFLYHLRVMLANIIAQALPQPQAALLIAILLGLHTPALSPLSQAFNVTGVAHLIVPGGFKVTILAGLIATSTGWLTKRRRSSSTALMPHDWRYRLSAIPILAGIATYTILSGAGSAAVRASIMGTLTVIAPRLGRVYNVYTALALTAFIMSIIDPLTLHDIGFLLTFLGTLGIIVLTPYLQRALHPIERLPLGSHIAEIIAMTLAAQIATLPLLAITFQKISLIAPIANLLTVPLLGLLIMLGLLICGAGLVSLPLATIAGWIAWPILWYVTHIILWCANLPGAYINVNNLDSRLIWGYYGLLLLLTIYLLNKPTTVRQVYYQEHTLFPILSRRSWRITQLSMAALVVITTGVLSNTTLARPQTTITFLSVGPAGQPAQGEAILLHSQDNKTILIDGGLDVASLSQALDSQLPPWLRVLDVVVLTSPERDHLTGLQDIVSRYQIGEIIDAGMLHPSATYALWRRTIIEHHLRYVSVVQGTTIAVGQQVTIQIVWPRLPLHKSSAEARDNALVMRLVMPGLHLLLLGVTAQSTYALGGLLINFDVNHLQADIVQIVGEMNKSVSPELREIVQTIHPSLLVITPAILSTQQHKLAQPSTIVPTASLEGSGADWQIIQTAQVGTIEISSSNNSWKMRIVK